MKRFLIFLAMAGLACGDKKTEAPSQPTASLMRVGLGGGSPNHESATNLVEIPLLLGDADYDGDVDFNDTDRWLRFLNTGSFFEKPTDNVDTLRNFILRIDCNCDGWANIGDIYSLLAFFGSTGFGINPWPGGLPGCLAPVTAARQQALLLRHHDLIGEEK